MKYKRKEDSVQDEKRLEDMAAQSSETKDNIEYIAMMVGVDLTQGESEVTQDGTI